MLWHMPDDWLVLTIVVQACVDRGCEFWTRRVPDRDCFVIEHRGRVLRQQQALAGTMGHNDEDLLQLLTGWVQSIHTEEDAWMEERPGHTGQYLETGPAASIDPS